jgi:hypothetical protein
VPQELYKTSKDGRCVHDTLYPALLGIKDRDAGTTMNDQLRRLGYLAVLRAPNQFSLAAYDEEMRKSLPDQCEISENERADYVVRTLSAKLVAVDFHYSAQTGDIRGSNWDECVIVDLEAGTIAELGDSFAPGGLEKLGELVHESILGLVPDSGPEHDNLDAIYWTMNKDLPMCFEDGGVRVAIIGHPLWGPPQPTIPYRAIFPLLAPGVVKDSLATVSAKPH